MIRFMTVWGVLLVVAFGCSEQVDAPGVYLSSQSEADGQQALAMPLNTPIDELPVRVDSDTPESVQTRQPDMSAKSAVRELEWDDLMPVDYRIEEILVKMNTGEIADDDPRVDEVMAKIKELYSKAPVVEALDNQQIRLPGFVVPLELDQEVTRDFLLVPYYGACIHVPPPPANQTVFVTGKESQFKLFDAVWVSGTMRVERSDNELGASGYSIIANDIAPYE